MALSTVADIRRVGKLADSIPDAELAPALETAESYLRTKLARWDDSAGGTTKFYNITGTAQLPLPSPDAIVTAVRLYHGYRDATGELVPTTDYATGTGYVTLLRDDLSSYYYARAEVTWTNVGTVPAAVRDGVAMVAASLYSQYGRATAGMRSERIGDYSYTLSDKDIESVVPAKALELLKPFFRTKSGVFVV